MKRLAIVLTALLLSATVVPPAMGQTSRSAYNGTHVSFETADNAVTNYTVDGAQTFSSVTVQSQSSAKSGGLLGAGTSLSAVTTLNASVVSLDARTNASATVEARNGATLTAHDNGHGILLVEPGNSSQYVLANLSNGANASAAGNSQVSVTTANGTKGTFLVVGAGNVTVNKNGDVAAKLGKDGRLVFRAYPDGKDDGDEKQEKLIADGKAKAEAYVMTEGKNTVVDTVSYGQNTTVEAKQTGAGAVNVTVDRAANEGTVVITSVSRKVMNASEDLEVRVSGEAKAAVRASTYTQLRSAVGSERSRYLVESAGSENAQADANAEILVAVNHFSKRTISMQAASPAQGTTTSDDTTTSGDETTADDSGTTNSGGDTTGEIDGSSGTIPGFTPITAVVALLAAALLARLR
ncbi:PGF-CTERM sorting domain-containing protein [Halorussus halophilus]|uniref:PGF-CTERM sorting domain-containing protein n=1 Tax=Halorussus halophilus TaxID=2650975 RepID=UPI0013016E38|nr:PGF-CTERM sorting domain-containing protein [Halorussus halophilus]